jgi:hypothetical protein
MNQSLRHNMRLMKKVRGLIRCIGRQGDRITVVQMARLLDLLSDLLIEGEEQDDA